MEIIQEAYNRIKTCRIGVLCGGYGPEREVSLRSGDNVFKILTETGINTRKINVGNDLLSVLKEQQTDAVYNALHGEFGEDGQIQPILRFLKLPFTGEDLLTSAVCYHKLRCKEVFSANYLKTPRYFSFQKYADYPVHDVIDRIGLLEFGYPVILKPVSGGSSIGVELIKNQADLVGAIHRLSKENLLNKYFLEEYIQGKEMTVGVFDYFGTVTVLPILGLKPKKEFYDYEAKYTHGMTDMEIPAVIPKNIEWDIKAIAQTLFQVFECRCCIRIDIILSGNIPYLLEINTSPGLTQTSDIPAMLKSAGISNKDFIVSGLYAAVEGCRR